MAHKPRLWSPGSFRKLKPGEQGYVSATATKYRILRGKRAGEIVSNAGRVTLIKGAHPSKLAAEHKAGVRPYKSAALEQLRIRFHAIKHRCGRDRHYRHVQFGFENAREAAEYMFAACGPLSPGLTIDRVNGRRGYVRGNMRYATTAEQLTNRRFKSHNLPQIIG